MTIKEQQEIIKAYSEGKSIQWKPNGIAVWKDIPYSENYEFDFLHYSYRIVEGSATKPYDVVEFLNAMKEHGPFIFRKDSKDTTFVQVGGVDSKGVYVICISEYYTTKHIYYTYEQLQANCSWQDGTLCCNVI